MEKCSDWAPKITNTEKIGCEVSVLEKLMFAMVKFYSVANINLMYNYIP